MRLRLPWRHETIPCTEYTGGHVPPADVATASVGCLYALFVRRQWMPDWRATIEVNDGRVVWSARFGDMEEAQAAAEQWVIDSLVSALAEVGPPAAGMARSSLALEETMDRWARLCMDAAPMVQRFLDALPDMAAPAPARRASHRRRAVLVARVYGRAS